MEKLEVAQLGHKQELSVRVIFLLGVLFILGHIKKMSYIYIHT